MTDRRLRDRVGDESGFTLVEILVAATLLAIGIFGLVTSVQTSHKLSDVSEHESVASQVADRELDLSLTVPYNSVALSSLPPTSGAADADGPRWNAWLSSGIVPQPSTSFSCGSASDANKTTTLPNDEQTCIDACATASTTVGCPALGGLAPVSTVSVPTVSGSIQKLKVYRYVTWVNDLACGADCPNTTASAYKGDYKRVTIAVLPVIGGTATSGVAATQSIDGPRQPIIVSAIRNDPTLSVHNTSSNDLPPCGGVVRC